jgi:hypothetical protein
MTPACDLPGEDLVAYSDDELEAPQRALVAAHLQGCPTCRRRLAAFQQVDRLLRAASPPLDDPAGRAALVARLEREAGRRARPPRHRQLLAAALVLLAVIAISGLVATGTQAGWTHVFRVPASPVPATLPAGQAPPGTRITGVRPAPPGAGPATFHTVEPASLPLGLALAERSTPNPERRELLYRNPDGLALLLVQVPARGPLYRPEDREHVTIVGDTEVVWLHDPCPGTVSGLLWIRRGVFFDLLVLTAPPGGVSLNEARQIVAALIEAQEVTR